MREEERGGERRRAEMGEPNAEEAGGCQLSVRGKEDGSGTEVERKEAYEYEQLGRQVRKTSTPLHMPRPSTFYSSTSCNKSSQGSHARQAIYIAGIQKESQSSSHLRPGKRQSLDPGRAAVVKR